MPALRIECRGRTVRVRALTRNGVQLQRLLEQRLPAVITLNRVADELLLDFPASDRTLDEDSRLKGSSVLDVLRTLQRELQCQQGKEALFMGGSFAYDLIASFEDLPEVPEGSNDCPDYCFYVAETLITIDHIKQSTALLACLFGGEQDESRLDERYAQLTARLEAFKQACQQPQPVAQGAKPLTGNLHIDKSRQAVLRRSGEAQGLYPPRRHLPGGAVPQLLPALPRPAGRLSPPQADQPQPLHVLCAG